METYTRKETIYPQKASELLSRNKNFRKLNPSKTSQYAEDMKHGRWIYNGEAIQIDSDGNLRNGQHRLTACILANVPFVTQVVYNVDTDLFDVGKSRNLAEYIENDGVLAGIAALVTKYERGHLDPYQKATGYTVPEKLETLKKHPELKNYADLVRKLKVQKPILGFCWWLFDTKKFKDKTKEFFTQFDSGEHINKSQPAFQLRKRLIIDKQKGMRLDQNVVLGLVMSALDFHVNGKPLPKRKGTEYLPVNNVIIDNKTKISTVAPRKNKK